jgi:2-hydroxy-3-keto-5-methylthiopentenyl-1-phosphate phosphatase
MNQHAPHRLERLLLVLDYDGTVTVDECNEIILQRFTGDAWRAFEARALDGSLSHAECFRRQFGLVRAPREELFAAMADLAEPAPGLASFLEWALAGGARVAVVSVGFREAIERVWRRHRLPPVELYASELQPLPEGGYTVVLDDLFGDCPACGPGGCKGGAVRALRAGADAVAAFGDGVGDLCLAREADIVFARGVLQKLCDAEGIAYYPLTDFETARAQLERWDDGGRRDVAGARAKGTDAT